MHQQLMENASQNLFENLCRKRSKNVTLGIRALGPTMRQKRKNDQAENREEINVQKTSKCMAQRKQNGAKSDTKTRQNPMQKKTPNKSREIMR